MEASLGIDKAIEVVNLIDETLPMVDLVTPTATPRICAPCHSSTPIDATEKEEALVTAPVVNNNEPFYPGLSTNGKDIQPFFIDSKPDYSYLTPQPRKKQKTGKAKAKENGEREGEEADQQNETTPTVGEVLSKSASRKKLKRMRKMMKRRKAAELEAQMANKTLNASCGRNETKGNGTQTEAAATPSTSPLYSKAVGYISLEKKINNDQNMELIDLESDDDRENQNNPNRENQNGPNRENQNGQRENQNDPNKDSQNDVNNDSDIEVIEVEQEIVVLSDDDDDPQPSSQLLAGTKKRQSPKKVLGWNNLPSFISLNQKKKKVVKKKTLQKNKRKFAELMNGPAPSLRPVIIDGSNVAYGHDKTGRFSCRGLKICVEYFKKRGHKVTIFLPQFRRRHPLTLNPEILDQLEKEGIVVFTPSRKVNGKMVVSYDDRYIVEYAHEVGGVIVSRDNYRDLLEENPTWASTINDRLLMYTWAGDMIMFPQDPLGRTGPQLSQFLSFPRT